MAKSDGDKSSAAANEFINLFPELVPTDVALPDSAILDCLAAAYVGVVSCSVYSWSSLTSSTAHKVAPTPVQHIALRCHITATMPAPKLRFKSTLACPRTSGPTTTLAPPSRSLTTCAILVATETLKEKFGPSRRRTLRLNRGVRIYKPMSFVADFPRSGSLPFISLHPRRRIGQDDVHTLLLNSTA